MSVLALFPRKAPGLPPGQRELAAMPRFSDKPLRWAPPIGAKELSVSIEGSSAVTVDEDHLGSLPSVEQVSDFHCVTTWSVRGLRWQGWPLVDVLASIGMDPEHLPAFAVAAAADKQRAIYMTEDLIQPEVLVAAALNGEALTPRHGAPLRLISPAQYGYKNVKHLVSIAFVNEQPESMLGPKEHLRARVALEERHATLPNWALRWPYRFTIPPTAMAAERGLRNSPGA
jgi:DMSO/TMAO reductase YedYZ molybdopterin-dependent catalytic subunit